MRPSCWQGCIIAGIAALATGSSRPVLAQTPSYEYLQAFSSVLNFVRLNYVEAVGYSELVRAAIEGTLHSLDPHSRFISREEQSRFSALERGELAIPGLVLEDVDSTVVVLSVVDRSPAERAGVQPGDRVVRVADTTVAGQRSELVGLRLAGADGSRVKVSFERGSRLEPDTFTLNLKREFLVESSVAAWTMVDSITGYVRLTEFGDRATRELRDALRQLRDKRARQLILDLRGNPGGIVTEAVEIASLFLEKGARVFQTRGRKASVNVDYMTTRDGEFDQPLIVLVDQRSASASEALAGSLQDNDRALIMGRRSFGKALMQMLFIVMPTQDNVWLTIGRVITPSGRIIQRRYKGLLYEQYRSLGGSGGAEQDTMQVFHTRNGRPVRGGGGIVPDVFVEGMPGVPVWWTMAADSGFLTAVADSVAHTLTGDPAARTAWLRAPERWQTALVVPLLARIRARLGAAATTTPAIEHAMGRSLAKRTAEVRWGEDAGRELWLATDSDVRAAVEQFPRIGETLQKK